MKNEWKEGSGNSRVTLEPSRVWNPIWTRCEDGVRRKLGERGLSGDSNIYRGAILAKLTSWDTTRELGSTKLGTWRSCWGDSDGTSDCWSVSTWTLSFHVKAFWLYLSTSGLSLPLFNLDVDSLVKWFLWRLRDSAILRVKVRRRIDSIGKISKLCANFLAHHVNFVD